MPVTTPARPPRTLSVSVSWRLRTVSCAEPMRSCAARRLSSRRSVSAHCVDLPVQRPVQGALRVLSGSGTKIAPSTYYAIRARAPSVRDSGLSGSWPCERRCSTRSSDRARPGDCSNAQQRAAPVARCTVERRMRALGLCGIGPGRSIRTTRPTTCSDATSPQTDPTSAGRRTSPRSVPSGFCYTPFVMDLFSRRIVGWATSSRTNTEFALGALEQAIWQRKDRQGCSLTGLVHHWRPRVAVPVHRLLRPAPGGGDRHLHWPGGLVLRQRRGRGPEQVLQVRADLDPILEGLRRPRGRRRRLGRLIQPDSPRRNNNYDCSPANAETHYYDQPHAATPTAA